MAPAISGPAIRGVALCGKSAHWTDFFFRLAQLSYGR